MATALGSASKARYVISSAMIIWTLLTGPTVVQAKVRDVCAVWDPIPQAELALLDSCGKEPVQRRIGALCVRHEWRCGAEGFEGWFMRWMDQAGPEVRVEQREGQFIFSQETGAQALALFWMPNPDALVGFEVLVSRMRSISQEKP